MARRWIYFYGILTAALISNSRNYNAVAADVVISENGVQKRMEVTKTTNSTSTLQTPTVIQQGNNLFIKPKFILDSPFSSYKQGPSPADRVSVTTKVRGEESSVVIGERNTPQEPTIVAPPVPPVVIPAGIANDGSISLIPTGVANVGAISLTRIQNQPQIPIGLPNLCHTMPCPPKVVPIPPYFPQLKEPSIVVEKPIRPVIIPEPPKLPPIHLPKLPIQVIVQRPVIPIPNHPIVVSSLCSQTRSCIRTEESLSMSRIFRGIIRSFKNLLTSHSETFSTMLSVTDQQTLPLDLPVANPTLCVQGIIAKRVVPNIVSNDKRKVFISPISPSQYVQHLITTENNILGA